MRLKALLPIGKRSRKMINLVLELLWPLTLMLVLLLISHKLILKHCGAKLTYALWGLVPVALAIYMLPIPWHKVAQAPNLAIQHYLVKPSEQFISVQPGWLFITWLAGALLIIGYWLVSHFRFSQQLSITKLSTSELALPLPKKLKAYRSDIAYSPMLLGLFKQKLIIPANFSNRFTRSQQKLILEHEICHFDRNDIYWNTLALFFVALFWFHPLVWLAYFKFRQDQELSCDQIVLARKQIASRIEYSKALLVVAEFAPNIAFAQLSFKKYGDKHMMFERIKQIKANTQVRKLSLAVIAAVSVGLLSGVSFAGNQGQATEQQYREDLSGKDQMRRLPPKQENSVKPIYRVEPKYPTKAAAESIEGSVVLKFDIDRTGMVKNVEVVNGSPAYVFDKVAKTALEQWQYEPSNSYHKNNLVQLDFAMNENSAKRESLIEQVKVTK